MRKKIKCKIRLKRGRMCWCELERLENATKRKSKWKKVKFIGTEKWHLQSIPTKGEHTIAQRPHERKSVVICDENSLALEILPWHRPTFYTRGSLVTPHGWPRYELREYCGTYINKY